MLHNVLMMTSFDFWRQSSDQPLRPGLNQGQFSKFHWVNQLHYGHSVCV